MIRKPYIGLGLVLHIKGQSMLELWQSVHVKQLKQRYMWLGEYQRSAFSVYWTAWLDGRQSVLLQNCTIEWAPCCAPRSLHVDGCAPRWCWPPTVKHG